MRKLSERAMPNVERTERVLRLPLRLTEKELKVLVHPTNEGPMAPLAKSPALMIKHVTGTLSGSDDERKVVLDMDASSFAIVSYDTSAKEQEKILKLVREKILEVHRFPLISFESSVVRSVDAGLEVEGALTLHGLTHKLRLSFSLLAEGHFRADVVLRQTDYGITPATAFMGALRSKDEVRIRLDLQLPPEISVGARSPAMPDS